MVILVAVQPLSLLVYFSMNMYPEFMYAKSLPYYAELLTVVTTVYCVFEWVTIFYYLSTAVTL